jgi:DNA-damage-inducible protein J
MSKSAIVRARIEPSLKEAAEDILTQLGLTPTEVVTLLYKQITFQRGLPFDVKIPNAVTITAMQDCLTGNNLTNYRSVEQLRADFEDEDEDEDET